MIKLQGNTKIQGKAMFGIEPEVIAFSPTDIVGLRGWYDYTYGVYRTNQNDFTNESASFTMNWVNGTASIQPIQLLGRNNYSGTFTQGARIGPGGIMWNGEKWVFSFDWSVAGNDDQETVYGSELYEATGNTQYPWQANWGEGKTATRTSTVNSTTASAGQTVAKWANKVGNLGNTYGGNMIQTILAQQPIFAGDSVEFTSQRLIANFGNPTSAARTYYFVGNSSANSTSNCVILASSSGSATTTIRGGLVHRLFNSIPRYGLNQGSSNNTIGYSSFEGDLYGVRNDIICASFESAGSGKIKKNNLDEQTLTNIGTQFSSSSVSLFVGSTQSFNSFKAKEILFYEGAHTTEQKNQVITYLNAKYNLF